MTAYTPTSEWSPPVKSWEDWTDAIPRMTSRRKDNLKPWLSRSIRGGSAVAGVVVLNIPSWYGEPLPSGAVIFGVVSFVWVADRIARKFEQ